MRLLGSFCKTKASEEPSNSRELKRLFPAKRFDSGWGRLCNLNIQKELRVLQLWML